jgi:hypothetical protein
MTEEQIMVVKSPIVPTFKETTNTTQGEEKITYENQVVYSVLLSNGLVVTGPQGFPDNGKQIEDSED